MKRILLAAISAIALVTLITGPAAAHIVPHVAAGAFVGTATLPNGALYSPVSNHPNCLPPNPDAPLCPAPPNGIVNWSFTILAGAGGHYRPPNGNFPGSPPGDGAQVQVAGPADIQGNVSGGTLNNGLSGLGPYCGASGGSGGVGTVTIDGTVELPAGPAETIDVANVGWAQSAATVIVYDGDTLTTAGGTINGGIAGVVSAIPPPPPNSCTNGLATVFTIVGTAIAIWFE